MGAATAGIQVDDMSDLERTVRKAAVDVESKRQILDAAIEIRDRLLVELYDTGATVKRVADVALVSVVRVQQIVARAG